MALVKKATLAKRPRGDSSGEPELRSESNRRLSSTAAAARSDVKATSRARRPTTALDRLDQATQELASGIGEASAAAAELLQAVEQISSGAEEAAGAAQESLGSIGHLRMAFRHANERATASRNRAERVQSAFLEIAAQIDGSVSAIELSARRQLSSVTVIERLEAAAQRIGTVGETVGDLSEQTAMLALNASIEASRAGDGGKGFAIVADEVRQLAEASETNAVDIRALADGIAAEVRMIAERVRVAAERATSEANAGAAVVQSLQNGRAALEILVIGAHEIAAAAAEAETAAAEAEKGAEQVASAAEEQSAAAAEAQQALDQQAASLEQSQHTAEALAGLSSGLTAGGQATGTAEQVAAAAEQLSATVQELSGASSEILVAIGQIGRGAQIQSAATLQASTAMSQIATAADRAKDRAQVSADRVGEIAATSSENETAVAKLISGVASAVEETREVLGLLTALGETSRRVEKITDILALGALQTNMLGVSGAVESTRAGEAGQGFATVTADIRKLARELAVNAEDGKDVVRTIQDEIVMVRRDLDQIAAAGEAEASRNQALLERFQAMGAELRMMRDDNITILESAAEIQRATREVHSGCDQIATAAEIAASASRQAGAAAAQQAQGAESLAAAVEDIASLATALAATSPNAT